MTTVILASGPSLIREDCELARAHADTVIAVNRSYELCGPNIIYAGDYSFLSQYRTNLPNVPVWTCSRRAARLWEYNLIPHSGQHNSGNIAIKLAVRLGAKRIVLLGFDCATHDGKTHWHGDHVNGLRNPGEWQYRRWRKQFADTAAEIKQQGVEVINASRQTTLDCYPRMRLEEALCNRRVRS